MHDIRFCDRCRADVSEGIFERVPHGWASYIRDNKVDRHDPVFDWVHRKIPSFLQCTIDDAYRPSFEIQGSTGQGVVSKSPRYSFPTKGSVRKGIFVCSQYEVRRDGGLGDYLVSIIVGRDELRKHASNSRLAIRETVERAREILGVDPGFRPRPQGVYRSEIIFQSQFRCPSPDPQGTGSSPHSIFERTSWTAARTEPRLNLGYLAYAESGISLTNSRNRRGSTIPLFTNRSASSRSFRNPRTIFDEGWA
ncbi:MAG: hypothetical protein ACE5HQ_08890 [Gemmatimonadota bacterium]